MKLDERESGNTRDRLHRTQIRYVELGLYDDYIFSIYDNDKVVLT